MTIHLKITMVLKSCSAAQSNMMRMASKKLARFGNFNFFFMSDNIFTGYLSVQMWSYMDRELSKQSLSVLKVKICLELTS